jgi:hypothetical protein
LKVQSGRAKAETFLLLIAVITVSEYFLSPVAIVLTVLAVGFAWLFLPFRYSFALALVDAVFAFFFSLSFANMLILAGEITFGGYAAGVFVLVASFLLYFSVVMAIGCVVGILLQKIWVRKGFRKQTQVTHERVQEKLLVSKVVNV